MPLPTIIKSRTVVPFGIFTFNLGRFEVKVKVKLWKVIHNLTVNISKLVADRADTAIEIDYKVEYESFDWLSV